MLSRNQRDIAQIRQLLDQAIAAGPKAMAEGKLTESDWLAVEVKIQQTRRHLEPSVSAVRKSAKLLEEAVILIENT